jgi:hypothetical protein
MVERATYFRLHPGKIGQSTSRDNDNNNNGHDHNNNNNNDLDNNNNDVRARNGQALPLQRPSARLCAIQGCDKCLMKRTWKWPRKANLQKV